MNVSNGNSKKCQHCNCRVRKVSFIDNHAVYECLDCGSHDVFIEHEIHKGQPVKISNSLKYGIHADSNSNLWFYLPGIIE